MATQMASARGLRSWQGGVLGGWVGLASRVYDMFGERLGVAGGGLEEGYRTGATPMDIVLESHSWNAIDPVC